MGDRLTLATLDLFCINHGDQKVYFNLKKIQCGDRLYTSESDVYRRQILTYKDGPPNFREVK